MAKINGHKQQQQWQYEASEKHSKYNV